MFICKFGFSFDWNDEDSLVFTSGSAQSVPYHFLLCLFIRRIEIKIPPIFLLQMSQCLKKKKNQSSPCRLYEFSIDFVITCLSSHCSVKTHRNCTRLLQSAHLQTNFSYCSFIGSTWSYLGRLLRNRQRRCSCVWSSDLKCALISLFDKNSLDWNLIHFDYIDTYNEIV